ncbi:MAG: aryl-sulfate sulfotransferase [Candidatus Bathyarchaeia archaeon]
MNICFRPSSRSKKPITAVFVSALIGLLLFSAIPLIFTEPLPSFTIPCRITNFGESWEGDFAFGLYQYDPANINLSVASYLVVMDSQANLLHLREWYGSSYLGEVAYVEPYTLLYQGEGGSYIHFWNFSSGEKTDFDEVAGHHDVDYNPSTDTVLTMDNYVREVNGTNYLFDRIVEYNSLGEELWSWDTYDHIPLSQQSIYNITTYDDDQLVVDFTHANSVQWLYNESIIYFNCRHTNTFYKINQTSGDLIWSCGQFGDFTLLDDQGNPVESLWFGCHDVMQVEPNVFIMFNNDFGNTTDFDNGRSAMQEITVNEQDMTAEVSWSWTAPPELYSPYWGEAARLPNGNRIGVFGTPDHQFAESEPFLVNATGAVLVEVSPESEVVKLYEFPYGWGIYRIEPLPIQLSEDQSSLIPTASVTKTPTEPSGTVAFPSTYTYAVIGAVIVVFIFIGVFLYTRTSRKR